MTILDEAVIERFESKLYKDPNSGCWLWTAGLFSNGYGAFGQGQLPGLFPQKETTVS